ncbi:MAG: chorismate-binding protein, partial [Pseudomonadota bacterium]
MDDTYFTKGGIKVSRQRRVATYADGIGAICERLNTQRGVILSSGFEFPGRYTAFDWAFSDPPIQFETRDKAFTITALNGRGAVLLRAIRSHLERMNDISLDASESRSVKGVVTGEAAAFDESRRSQQPTIFTMLRHVSDLFRSDEDNALGLYGAFSYDLGFQFEPIDLKTDRPMDHRDIVLFLPDEILMIDHMTEVAQIISYDFTVDGQSSEGLPRETPAAPMEPPKTNITTGSDHAPGEYADSVEKARERFKCGDLFEAVLSQTFTHQYNARPSELFDRLRTSNPAPYGAFMNLG